MERMMNQNCCKLIAALLLLLVGCQKHEQRDIKEKTKFWLTGDAGKLFIDGGSAKATTAGLPVILIHSLAGNTTQWHAQLEHLRQTRRAMAFDMRGHGQSEPARDHDYSLAAMAQDVAAVADSLRLEKFILIGHSYGGGVIATYASQYPEKVAGLLLVDPIGDLRSIPKAALDEWMNGFRSETYAEAVATHWRRILLNADSAVTKSVIGSLKKTPKEVVVGALESTLAFDPAAVLKNYHGPMQTIVSGLPDSPMALHHAIPNLPRVAMPGTSHWLQMDRPEEFNRLMDEFLSSVGENYK
jgi:pimeloyl-ACP methyl ester carboxylesterase